jgi:hypothetical protein
MTTIINAVASSGLTQTADGSGIIKLQSNGVTTNALAWVNFGYVASAVTIRASYNVSSITRSAAGNYTLNFSTALSDANYVTNGAGTNSTNACLIYVPFNTGNGGAYTAPTTSNFIFATMNSVVNGSLADPIYYLITVFGN